LELKALQDLFRSQQLELHDMQQRISRFMTKGAPLIRTAAAEGFGGEGDVRRRIASAKARLKSSQQRRELKGEQRDNCDRLEGPSSIAVVVQRPDE
jgi:hypothetical protein